jgi:hypothetical protein
MLCCSLPQTQIQPANRIVLFRRVSLILIAAAFVSCIACGSNNAASVSTTAPIAPTATASLKISSSLPAATVDSAYDATLTVTGGTSPYTFSTASGQLPEGVSLDASTGAISGTPTTSGNFNFVISAVDSKEDSAQQSLQISVASAPAPTPPPAPAPSAPVQSGKSFSSLQHSGGWDQFGQKGPNYVDCSPSPCDGISFSMTQDVKSPSISGQASEYNVGGSAPFSDGLWNNHLIGPSSSQGLPDNDQTLVPTLHNFTYDVYFYGDNLGLSQALEFDINQFFNSMGFIWGHECRIASGNEWDVWDNQKQRWTPTGIACNPKSNSWNHLTLKVQRTSDNNLVYQSIALNGVTSNLNWTFGHGSAKGWYGVTLNYQMDGNDRQDSYNVYLDNLTFSYD